MTTSTRNIDIYGKGFIAENVPNFLDDTCKVHPTAVFKTEGAAARKADAEALWHARNDVDAVEGIVATQIDGFDGLWFVVFIYTDEVAERMALYEARLAAQSQR